MGLLIKSIMKTIIAIFLGAVSGISLRRTLTFEEMDMLLGGNPSSSLTMLDDDIDPSLNLTMVEDEHAVDLEKESSFVYIKDDKKTPEEKEEIVKKALKQRREDKEKLDKEVE